MFFDQIRETLITILEKWQTIPSDDDTSSDDETPSKMDEIALCLTPEVNIINIYKLYHSRNLELVKTSVHICQNVKSIWLLCYKRDSIVN